MSVGEIIGLILKFVPELAKIIKEIIELFKKDKDFSGKGVALTQEEADKLKALLDDVKAKFDGMVA